jgi:hypothetical protein
MPFTFGPFTLDHDTPTTRKAYADIRAGGADTCTCAMCRNWVAIRDRVLPSEFRDLLDRLGIDYTKDGEVVHYSRRDDGLHYYDGWYHGIGVMLSEPTTEMAIIDGVEIVIDWSNGTDLFFEQLRGYPFVRVSFSGFFPWVLEGEDEPE